MSGASRAQFLLGAARLSNFAFARVICDRDRLRDEHKAWDALLKRQYLLALMPRESLKTTYFVESYLTKKILDEPMSRILLITESYEPHAPQRVNAIKENLMSAAAEAYCPGIRNRIRRATIWTRNAISIPTPAGPRRTKEYNLIAAGIDQPQTGGHFDYIVVDDAVMDDDATSEAVRAQKRAWLPNVFSMAENHTQIIFVGTRWHPEDLYGTIMKEYPQFTVYKQGIYNADGSLWLAEFYEERLPLLRRHPVHFSHQYLNEAIAGEDKRVYLDWFKDVPMPNRDDFALVVIGIDPAFGEKDEKKLCFKTAACLGVDKDLNVWLLDGALSRDSLEKFKENDVRTLYRRWRPHFIRIENNGPQKGAELFFKTDREYGGIVRGTDANMATDKFARAQGWVAHAETAGIYTVKGAWWEEAAYQLDYFPQGDYKDFPDAISCAWPDVDRVIKYSNVDFRPVHGAERVRLQL